MVISQTLVLYTMVCLEKTSHMSMIITNRYKR
nr:MAG TPA: hypothetical protein [Caudoviricetes sp.]